MATDEGTTETPTLALVINAADHFQRGKDSSYGIELHHTAADEIIEDVIGVLSLLEAFAWLDNEKRLIDPHAVSSLASMLVEKLRRAQRHLAEAKP